MRRFSLPSFAAGAVAATALVAVPATAAMRAAQVDATPGVFDATAPSLTVQPVQFVIGSSIDAAASGSMCAPGHFRVPMLMQWSGSDAGGGLAGYNVYGRENGDEILTSDIQDTSMPVWGGDYGGDCGGGGVDGSYGVIAKDNRGNSAKSPEVINAGLEMWQENGVEAASIGYQTATLPLAKAGTWMVSKCGCSDAGATMYSTKAGASASYTVTTTRPGQTVGVVMGKNTNRGQVTISVDGRVGVTLDTYAASAKNRVIVWQSTLGVGKHTVKLTNAGTAGRSRIDIDTVMLTWAP
jgi:hypothetical protein